MSIRDYKEVALETVPGERYEARQGRAGEKLITMKDAPESSGCICRFPKREGREHLQEARAVMMAAAPEMYFSLMECVHQLRLAGHDRLSVDPVINAATAALKKARGEA